MKCTVSAVVVGSDRYLCKVVVPYPRCGDCNGLAICFLWYDNNIVIHG